MKGLFVYLFFCVIILANAQYVTDVKCTEDNECNQGECIAYNGGNYCQCDNLYHPRSINGTEVPCIRAVGKILPAGIISFVVVYIASMFFFLIIHISVIVSLSLSSRTKKKRIQSWQFDPRVTFICLTGTCIFTILWAPFYLYYSFEETTNERYYVIIADMSKVCYFQAGSAVIFYWMLAVQATPQKAQEIVKKPILAITYAIFIIWWVISSFVHSDNNESITNGVYYFRLIMALLFLVSLVVGLIYYGRQILRLLVPQADSSTQLAERIGFFLRMGGFILIAFILLFILTGFINVLNTPVGFLVTSMWMLMILEWMIHTIFLVIFSAGSLARIKNGILWVWKGKDRKGKSPMDIVNDVVGDDDSNNTPTITPSTSAKVSTEKRESEEEKRGSEKEKRESEEEKTPDGTSV